MDEINNPDIDTILDTLKNAYDGILSVINVSMDMMALGVDNRELIKNDAMTKLVILQQLLSSGLPSRRRNIVTVLRDMISYTEMIINATTYTDMRAGVSHVIRIIRTSEPDPPITPRHRRRTAFRSPNPNASMNITTFNMRSHKTKKSLKAKKSVRRSTRKSKKSVRRSTRKSKKSVRK